MSEPIFRSSKLERDIASILDELVDNDAVQAATRFLAAVERTIDGISDFPDIGVPLRRGGRLFRIRSIRGFRNYLIYFRRVESGVLVSRILHGRRDLDKLL
jgi:toxin ParE1/3/4